MADEGVVTYPRGCCTSRVAGPSFIRAGTSAEGTAADSLKDRASWVKEAQKSNDTARGADQNSTAEARLIVVLAGKEELSRCAVQQTDDVFGVIHQESSLGASP